MAPEDATKGYSRAPLLKAFSSSNVAAATAQTEKSAAASKAVTATVPPVSAGETVTAAEEVAAFGVAGDDTVLARKSVPS